MLTLFVKLIHIKVLNGWSNKSLDILLELMKDVLPKEVNISASHYESRKMLRDLELGYESIDVCKYDCALFWKEYEHVLKCLVCEELRFQHDDGRKNKILHKVLRHFPLIPRLKRLFMSRHTSVDIRWHKEKRINEEGVLRHPADAQAWKDFDQ